MSMFEEVPSEKQSKPNIKSGCNSECLVFTEYKKRGKTMCVWFYSKQKRYDFLRSFLASRRVQKEAVLG